MTDRVRNDLAAVLKDFGCVIAWDDSESLVGVDFTWDELSRMAEDLLARFREHPAEVLATLSMTQVRTCCRECNDQEPPVSTPAEFILWGKLFPPEALGPRCYDHAAKHIGWSGMSRIDQYAVFDLRTLLLSPKETHRESVLVV